MDKVWKKWELWGKKFRKCQNSQEQTGKKAWKTFQGLFDQSDPAFLSKRSSGLWSDSTSKFPLSSSALRFRPLQVFLVRISSVPGSVGFICIILPFIASWGARAEALTDIRLLLGRDDDISACRPIGLRILRFHKQELQIHIWALL